MGLIGEVHIVLLDRLPASPEVSNEIQLRGHFQGEDPDKLDGCGCVEGGHLAIDQAPNGKLQPHAGAGFVIGAQVVKAEAPATNTTVLLEFMFRLGRAYLACGEQTAKVELILRRTASAYGMRKSRVVAFPTAVFISLHDEAGERVSAG